MKIHIFTYLRVRAVFRTPSPMEMECSINISSEGATSQTSPDLCRTFGALFRDNL